MERLSASLPEMRKATQRRYRFWRLATISLLSYASWLPRQENVFLSVVRGSATPSCAQGFLQSWYRWGNGFSAGRSANVAE
ncbi:hypothetical protein CHELA41_20113 [Hyphomicrobiales bacterium]|nr:hypothetical protein CHELA41_20113 [Hyphomicrobiales bacterium]